MKESMVPLDCELCAVCGLEARNFCTVCESLLCPKHSKLDTCKFELLEAMLPDDDEDDEDDEFEPKYLNRRL